MHNTTRIIHTYIHTYIYYNIVYLCLRSYIILQYTITLSYYDNVCIINIYIYIYICIVCIQRARSMHTTRARVYTRVRYRITTLHE